MGLIMLKKWLKYSLVVGFLIVIEVLEPQPGLFWIPTLIALFSSIKLEEVVDHNESSIQYRILNPHEVLQEGDQAISKNTLNWKLVNTNDILFKRTVEQSGYYLIRRAIIEEN